MKSYVLAAYLHALYLRDMHRISTDRNMNRIRVSIADRFIPSHSPSNYYSTIHRSINSEAEQFFFSNSLG